MDQNEQIFFNDNALGISIIDQYPERWNIIDKLNVKIKKTTKVPEKD